VLKPLAVLELVAFWPLVIGIFALLSRRRLAGKLERASRHSYDAARSRALNRSIVYGALLLIDIGLGATVWSYASDGRPAVFASALAIGLALLVLTVTNVFAARKGRSSLVGAARVASKPEPDSLTAERVPYSGIVETAIAKILVDDADPAAGAHRTMIHRLVIVAPVICVMGALAIVGIMLVEVISKF
jgi:hypothetical protein